MKNLNNSLGENLIKKGNFIMVCSNANIICISSKRKAATNIFCRCFFKVFYLLDFFLFLSINIKIKTMAKETVKNSGKLKLFSLTTKAALFGESVDVTFSLKEFALLFLELLLFPELWDDFLVLLDDFVLLLDVEELSLVPRFTVTV